MSITGAHLVWFTPQAERVREFLRDVVGFDHVDAGGGWLIFALPPAEIAVHPAEGRREHELYLMCDDLDATLADLAARGVERVGEIQDEDFGRMAAIAVPDGGTLGLYEPRHPTALEG